MQVYIKPVNKMQHFSQVSVRDLCVDGHGIEPYSSHQEYFGSLYERKYIVIIILSRVYGCVTNNNGGWIGLLDLLTPSGTISFNHNQSSAEPFFLGCRGLAPFSFSFYD
jgi:hypothetical protein